MFCSVTASVVYLVGAAAADEKRTSCVGWTYFTPERTRRDQKGPVRTRRDQRGSGGTRRDQEDREGPGRTREDQKGPDGTRWDQEVPAGKEGVNTTIGGKL